MKYESRKFVDLILTSTSKWANWDPPNPIKVGDFGKINKETGEFEWQGTIYDRSFQDQFGDALGIDLQDADLQPVTQEKTDDYVAVSSRGVAVKVVDLSVGVNVPGIAAVGIRVDCRFEHKRGAALVMYKPQITRLPRDGKLVKLVKEFHAVLKGKCLVTEVTSCPAYFLVMSTQEGESLSASLDANVPVPLGFAVGGAVKGGWSVDAFHGMSRSGYNTLPIFCPLYKLKEPPFSFWEAISGRRSEGMKSDSVENWEDVRPPWDPLNEDGGEDEVYDAALEGDELGWD